MTKTFEEFAEKYGLRVEVRSVDTRPESNLLNPEWDTTATHYEVILKQEGRSGTIWHGYYSKGFGHAENWAKNNKSNPKLLSIKDHLLNPLPYNRRWLPESEYVKTIRHVAGPKVAPGVEEVLESLAMDAMDSDQSFEDWADSLGYSDDSISAKKIWENCNDIRWALQSTLGNDALNELYEIEE